MIIQLLLNFINKQLTTFRLTRFVIGINTMMTVRYIPMYCNWVLTNVSSGRELGKWHEEKEYKLWTDSRIPRPGVVVVTKWWY